MTTGRILLGLSFFNQTTEVTDTLESFRTLRSQYEVVLGLENEKPRPEFLTILQALRAQGWSACYVWDDTVNRAALKLLRPASAKPFFSTFSYGAAVNRLLLLAQAAGCESLVRLDPGTSSPTDGTRLVRLHLDALSQGKRVVSAQYSGRVAIRDDFVAEERRAAYYDLVRTATGIDCRPGCQVTGGAAMTIRSDGPPAIVFDDVRVWGSDDGFFQAWLGPKATEVQREIPITRTEPGFGLQLTAYVARVAAMMVLRHAVAGSGADAALREADSFIEDIASFVTPQYAYDPEAAARTITPQVPRVYEGYDNYRRLVDEWPSIASDLTAKMQLDALVAWC